MRLMVLMSMVTASAALAATPLPGMQATQVDLLNDETKIELLLIDHERQRLQFDKASLTGPIFTLVVSGTAVSAGAVFAVLFSATNGVLAIVGLVAMGVVALPLALGVVWLFANIAHNDRIDAIIGSLNHRRRELQPLSLAPSVMNTLARF